ncbi:MAG: fibronectin-binding autotransporter adhesin [Brevundimonas sp.]|jgi:fibronectin-binding autotransporter adhesin|uniref:autotransporter-associated beta strand repeat-containing protein n=1 Tax=Brevundimonas sp. TaxID=1871086 RepID=UPI0039E678B2
MTSINSRAVAGARSAVRAARSTPAALIRRSLLGSTALVAASLMASGALAQNVTTFTTAGAQASDIRLEMPTNPAAFPNVLTNGSDGIVTLDGRIYETGVGAVGQYVTFAGFGSTFIITNADNSWGGITTIDPFVALRGTSASISGSSIVNNGFLTFDQTDSGAVAQDISGSGVVAASGSWADETLTFDGTLTNSGGLLFLGGVLGVIGQTGSVSTASETAVVLDRGSALTNAGEIAAGDGPGVLLMDGGAVTNTGTISGGNNAVFGFGIQNASSGGTVTITNQSGGLIDGTRGSILLNGAGDTTIDLQTGSTTTGWIESSAAGRHDVTIAGTLNGGYNASVGAGIDHVTLAATGSMGRTELGAGDDSFTFQGGSFYCGINGGDGFDDFYGDLGDEGAASIDLGAVAAFEAITGVSGVLTLNNGGSAWTGQITIDSGATISTTVAAIVGSSIVSNGTLEFRPLDSATFDGVISGTGGLTVDGDATLTLTGENTYSGMTRVNAGTLRLGRATALAAGSSLTVATGAGFDLSGYDLTLDQVLLSGYLTGSWVVMAPLSDGAAAAPTGLQPMRSGTLTATDYHLNGATVFANLGTGNLYNTGGVSTLYGAAAAGLVSVEAGVLRLGGNNRLADTAVLSVASGAILDLRGYDETVATAWLNGSVYGQAVLSGDGPLGASLTGVETAPGVLLPFGTGTLTAADYYLDGADVFANLGTGNLFNTGGISTLYGTAAAGQVTVQAGTLRLGASDRLADTAIVSVATGATLDLLGYDETVALAVISGTLNSRLPNPGAPAAATIGGQGPLADQPLPTGSGTLTAIEFQLHGAWVNANLGTGSLFNLSGVSTLNGTAAGDEVSVQGGTLRLGLSDRLADGATLRVWDGAVLDLMGHDETVALAVLNGSVDNSYLFMEFATMPTGSQGADGLIGTPVETGTGTLTAAEYQLFGASIYANLGSGNLFNTGGVSALYGLAAAERVSVQAGTLRLGGSDRLADTAVLSVGSNAILDLQGFDETVGAAWLSGTLNGWSMPFSPQPDVFDKSPELVAWNPPPPGSGTLTAAHYYLDGAEIFANLGTGILINTGGDTILYGRAAAGQVTVEAGTLMLGISDRLADTATLSVWGNATLDLMGNDETVALALLSGSLNSRQPNRVDPATTPVPVDGPQAGMFLGTGTLTAAEYQLDGASVSANLGTGNLFNTGGVSTLLGTAAAGLVSVQTGTLRLWQSDRLADTATVSVLSGATLDLMGNDETVALAVLNGALDSTRFYLIPTLGVDTTGPEAASSVLFPTGSGTLTAAQYQLNGATINANLGIGALFNMGGVSTLNGTAAASGLSIQAGTLRLGASDRLADTALVGVSSGATFDVNSRTETIGSLFGAGNVAIGSGRLTLGGADSAFGGSLSGTGSLVHTGGLFILSGSHSLQTLSNTGGELRWLGSSSGGVAVSSGSLTGAGTIGGALTVSGGATLSPGLAGPYAVGTFAVGSLTLNGGTLALDVLGTAGGNLIDRLVVSGTANLTGGIVAPTFQAPAGGYDFLTRYQFLTAGQRVGTFSNGAAFTESSAGSGLFWRVRYDLNPNSAVLELRNLIDFDPGTKGTGNQGAVGEALSGGQLEASEDWVGVLNLLGGLDGPQRQAALDSLGGEALADVSGSMLAANAGFVGALRGQGSTGGSNQGPLNFASAFSFVGGRDGTSAMVTGVLDAFDPAAVTGQGRGGWISVYASDVDLDGKAGQSGVRTRMNGFIGGYSAGAGDHVVGIALGASRVEGDVAGRQSTFESDQLHAAGFARYDNGRWIGDLTASVFGGEIDSRRVVSVGAFTGQATGRTRAEGQSLSASIARRFRNETGGSISVGLMETLSRSTMDAFTETGAGALSLDVADQTRNWQTTQLNLRGTQDYRLSGRSMRLYGGAGVLVTTGDRQASADLRFSGAGAGFGGFAIEGAETPPLAGVAELGLAYEPREGLTLSAGYRGVFSNRLRDNQLGARMSIEW